MTTKGLLSASAIAAAVVALVPLAGAGAATKTPYWNLTGFKGAVTVLGTRPATLSCADVAAGPREEIVAGRYKVAFQLAPAGKNPKIGHDSHGQPRTLTPLRLRFAVASTTRETVRVLTPNSDGSGCTASTRSCEKSSSSTPTDRFSVSTRKRRVRQRLPGSFVNPSFLPCASAQGASGSIIPAVPLTEDLLDKTTPAGHFQHRRTDMIAGRDVQLGTGDVTVAVSAKLGYTRVSGTTRG